MKRFEIENRISMVQDRLSRVSHPQDIAACNRIIEQLVMMDADDDQECHLCGNHGTGACVALDADLPCSNRTN